MFHSSNPTSILRSRIVFACLRHRLSSNLNQNMKSKKSSIQSTLASACSILSNGKAMSHATIHGNPPPSSETPDASSKLSTQSIRIARSPRTFYNCHRCRGPHDFIIPGSETSPFERGGIVRIPRRRVSAEHSWCPEHAWCAEHVSRYHEHASCSKGNAPCAGCCSNGPLLISMFHS